MRKQMWVILVMMMTGLLWGAGFAGGMPQPLLHYTFDEASSGTTTVLDQGSGTPANGSFVGSATRIANTPAGLSRGALDVSMSPGNNHYVSGGNATKLNALTNLTITAWINMRANPASGDRLVSWGTAFEMSAQSTSASALTLGFMISEAYVSNTTTFDAFEKWVFVAVTWDGTTRRYFKGGEPEAEGVAQLSGTSPYSAAATPTISSTFRVSSTALTAADRTPPAWIDDVRIYDVALTVSQLESIRRDNILPKGTVIFIR